jgi:hypothetical protein
MYMIINALILALLVPSAGTERAQNGPACRAELTGHNLLTTVDLPGGLTIEGPWRVVHKGEQRGRDTHWLMFATLDRVIENDAISGERTEISFPEPVSLAFEGNDQNELVHRAAQVWCVTVMRAQENRALDRLSPSQQAALTRIAMLPRTKIGA